MAYIDELLARLFKVVQDAGEYRVSSAVELPDVSPDRVLRVRPRQHSDQVEHAVAHVGIEETKDLLPLPPESVSDWIESVRQEPEGNGKSDGVAASDA